MNKNNMIISLVSFILLSGVASEAQTKALKTTTAPTTQVKKAAPTTPAAPINPNAPKKKVKLDYDDDTVMGSYDVPDAQFINSRRMIKYKELFNKRTNFIEEIDANKGLFNEY